MMTNTETCNSRVLDEASKVIIMKREVFTIPVMNMITVVSVLL